MTQLGPKIEKLYQIARLFYDSGLLVAGCLKRSCALGLTGTIDCGMRPINPVSSIESLWGFHEIGAPERKTTEN